jgi:hypothetical protein
MSTNPGDPGPVEDPRDAAGPRSGEGGVPEGPAASASRAGKGPDEVTGAQPEERPRPMGDAEATQPRVGEGAVAGVAGAAAAESLAKRYDRAHDSQHKPRTPAEAKYARRNAEAAAAGGIGDGAQRYAVAAGDVPPSGSEESWSAEPHPGFRTDPVLRKAFSTRRLAVGSVAGVCVLAFLFWFGAKGLASKSPNGNGSAPWTAAPKVNGAVVNGINAQNNIGDAAYNNGTAAAIVRGAAAECADPINDPAALAAGAGQAVALTGWGSVAGTTLNAIQQEAQSLNTAVEAQDIPKIAAAAQAMCSVMIKARNLPPVLDDTATGAWKATLQSAASAVKDALQGSTGNPFQFNAAQAELANVQTALTALKSRVGVS